MSILLQAHGCREAKNKTKHTNKKNLISNQQQVSLAATVKTSEHRVCNLVVSDLLLLLKHV